MNIRKNCALWIFICTERGNTYPVSYTHLEQEVAEYWYLVDDDSFWTKFWKKVKTAFGGKVKMCIRDSVCITNMCKDRGFSNRAKIELVAKFFYSKGYKQLPNLSHQYKIIHSQYKMCIRDSYSVGYILFMGDIAECQWWVDSFSVYSRYSVFSFVWNRFDGDGRWFCLRPIPYGR